MGSEYPSEFSTVVGDFGGAGAGVSQPRLNVMRMLRLRWPGMLIVFLIFAIPSAVLAWILVPAQYTAVATLRFLSIQPRVLTESNIPTVPYDKFVNTQINTIMDYEILGRALMEPEVKALPVIQNQRAPLEFLKEKIVARQQPGTELVRVMCTLPERDATKVLVDAVTKVYLNIARNDDAAAGGRQMTTLLERQRQYESELASGTSKLVALQRRLNIPLPYIQNIDPSDSAQYEQAIANAETELSAANSRMETSKRVLDQAKEALASFEENPSAPVYQFGVETDVSANAKVAALRASLATADTDLAIKTENFRDSNPQLQSLRKNRDRLESHLREEEIEARREALSSFLAMQQMEYDDAAKVAANATDLRDQFVKKLEEHQGSLEDATETWTEYQDLLRTQDETRDQLQRVTDQINTIRIEESAPARVQPASAAIVPEDPDFGKKLQFMLLGIIASGGLGVMFGLWRELIDQQVRSPQDIVSMTSVPLIAAIPHLSEDRLPADVHSPLLSVDHPNSPTADEFRRLLVRILYPAEGATEINSCLVTSPTRGDGKTSTACNLAIALAEADRRVLLLDISSREATIERSFHLEEAPGVCDILCGSGTLMEYIRPIAAVPNLYVLGPGFGDGDLAGRLASRELLELLEEAEHEFEHVIIDSPPNLLMADARLLAPVVDGVVVVVGAGVSTIGMVRRCLRELDQVGATVIGIALNRLLGTRSGYMRTNYDLYYNYASNRQQPWEAPDVPEMQVVDQAPAPDEPELILLEHNVDEQPEPRGASRP